MRRLICLIPNTKRSLGIDSTTGNSDIHRYVNVYGTTGDNTDETMTIAGFFPVSAGGHSFYLLGKRFTGTGTVRVHDPTLNILYIPAPSFTTATCAVPGNQTIDVVGSAYTAIRECTLDLPTDSWVYVSGNASVNLKLTHATVQFRIGVDDNTQGDWQIDRLVDLRADSGDGSDNNIAITNLRWLTKGTHTFYLLGRPYEGAGSVRIYDPTLSVLALGASEVYLPLALRSGP